jgi:hypothetical protein
MPSAGGPVPARAQVAFVHRQAVAGRGHDPGVRPTRALGGQVRRRPTPGSPARTGRHPRRASIRRCWVTQVIPKVQEVRAFATGEYCSYPGIGCQDQARHRLDVRFRRLQDAVVGRARKGTEEALVVATRHRGQLIDEPDVGVLDEGARADSVVLRGGPFEDITGVCHIDAVRRAGQQVVTSSGAARAVTNRGENRTAHDLAR